MPLNVADYGGVTCLKLVVVDIQPVNIGDATSDIDSTLPSTVSGVYSDSSSTLRRHVDILHVAAVWTGTQGRIQGVSGVSGHPPF